MNTLFIGRQFYKDKSYYFILDLNNNSTYLQDSNKNNLLEFTSSIIVKDLKNNRKIGSIELIDSDTNSWEFLGDFGKGSVKLRSTDIRSNSIFDYAPNNPLFNLEMDICNLYLESLED